MMSDINKHEKPNPIASSHNIFVNHVKCVLNFERLKNIDLKSVGHSVVQKRTLFQKKKFRDSVLTSK
jgi:hypothetical protein